MAGAEISANPALQFSNLIQAILDAYECLPPIYRNQHKDLFPPAIDSLNDCRKVLRAFCQFPDSLKQDIAIDFQYYLENNREEFEKLGQHPQYAALTEVITRLAGYSESG